jgi:superfamily II DNA or RNA helicase
MTPMCYEAPVAEHLRAAPRAMSDAPQAQLLLRFEGGTLCLEGLERASDIELPAGLMWDARGACHRIPAVEYARLIRWLRASELPYGDQARGYTKLEEPRAVRQKPFPYQNEALEAWRKNDGRGVVVLPTGSGKTFVATMAIDRFPRSTLVVVPTLDLLSQWYDLLRAAYSTPVGIIGGGYHEPEAITVTTYDSAHLHMDRLGNRYGLVVFDECHHLPSEAYAMAARCCLAPFRLGLTATPERNDGGEALYEELIGPEVYRKDIDELSGSYLASYETQRIAVQLDEAERAEYDQERGLYLSFLRRHGIRMSSPRGWSDFIVRSSRSDEGRRAFAGYRRQRQLALTARAKLETLERLLHAHRGDRTILFTEDNATVYQIARRFLLPAITHQTKVKERSAILKAFNAGTLTAVVTSKVLNEGVNVPEANVAIVLSGSGSVREHVQRLGRILRKREGKRAILYELVTRNTAEENISAKRREHSAYQ